MLAQKKSWKFSINTLSCSHLSRWKIRWSSEIFVWGSRRTVGALKFMGAGNDALTCLMKIFGGLLTDAGSLSKEISWIIQTVATAKDEALISEIYGWNVWTHELRFRRSSGSSKRFFCSRDFFFSWEVSYLFWGGQSPMLAEPYYSILDSSVKESILHSPLRLPKLHQQFEDIQCNSVIKHPNL